MEDFEKFSNDTVAQRKKFGQEVKTYVEQKKAINKQYADAYNYEMKQIHFKKSKDGRWAFSIDNEDTIIDKWTDAQVNDIEARQELKEDFINYQKSIAAEKAAFRATAKAQWPKKFEAYKEAVIDFDNTMGYTKEWEEMAAKMDKKPAALITDFE